MRAILPISRIGKINRAVLPHGEVVGRHKGLAPIRLGNEPGFAGRVHTCDAYPARTRPAGREDTALAVHRQGREAPPLAFSVLPHAAPPAAILRRTFSQLGPRVADPGCPPRITLPPAGPCRDSECRRGRRPVAGCASWPAIPG